MQPGSPILTFANLADITAAAQFESPSRARRILLRGAHLMQLRTRATHSNRAATPVAIPQRPPLVALTSHSCPQASGSVTAGRCSC